MQGDPQSCASDSFREKQKWVGLLGPSPFLLPFAIIMIDLKKCGGGGTFGSAVFDMYYQHSKNNLDDLIRKCSSAEILLSVWSIGQCVFVVVTPYV